MGVGILQEGREGEERDTLREREEKEIEGIREGGKRERGELKKERSVGHT